MRSNRLLKVIFKGMFRSYKAFKSDSKRISRSFRKRWPLFTGQRKTAFKMNTKMQVLDNKSRVKLKEFSKRLNQNLQAPLGRASRNQRQILKESYLGQNPQNELKFIFFKTKT